jgi:glycine dehydrogenase
MASSSTYEPYDFANRRHIGPSPEEMAEMLRVVGAPSLDALIDETVPEDIRQKTPLEFGRPLSERGALDRMRATAAKNRVLTTLIGQGYHGTIMPPAIQRNILENPAWYTAYTPYQPEISQGRLEALLNFQTLVSDLTALDVANASLLDEATAAAEAMALAHRVTKSKATAFFVDAMCLPQTIAVLKTRAEPLGWEIIVGDPFRDLKPESVFGALFQYPGVCGAFHDFVPLIETLDAAKALAVVAADPLALTLLKPPGEMGADIAIGSMQRFGMPMGYGGPHAAYIAVKDAYKRALPGRIVGVSVDARGNRAYRLALQTREQHIRRESATSNICTAQVLPAVIASMYAVFHGPKGLRAIAERVHRKAVRLAAGLASLGFKIAPGEFFDTITVEVGPYQGLIMKNAIDYGVNLRKVGHGRIGITVDERTRPATLEAVWRAFGGYDLVYRDEWPEYRLPKALIRQSAYLTNPVFHMNRAESEMTRYMRRLADRDLALDRAMIPLGSCTMKLNATAEMLPITWPEFAELHPFVPADQAQGYAEMIEGLAKILCQITGYDVMSMQPNSGAQGEYAGLLTIRAYHRARGEAPRRLPDPGLRARHKSRFRQHVRDEGRGRRDRRPRQYRCCRFPRQGRGERRQSRCRHDHLSLDPWRIRILGARDLRHHPRQWRPGLSRRRQYECIGGARAARRYRRRCRPSEFAQDVLHSAWRRRTGHGADRGQGPSRRVPPGPSRNGGKRDDGLGGALRLGLDPGHSVELLPDDGGQGPYSGHARRHP